MPDIWALFPEYDCIAFDVNNKNKDSVLLIRSNRFIIKNQDYFWLSDEPLNKNRPEQPSWGGKSPRIVISATLLDRQTYKEFIVFCTHFDSDGMESRIKSAEVLMQQLAKSPVNIPIILVGDFNFICTPPIITKKSEEAYALIAHNTGLHDVRDISGKNHYGPDGTWVGWPYDKYAAPFGTIGERLDHIFVRQCVVLKEGALNLKVNNDLNACINLVHNEFKNSGYPSDHLPIIADMLVQ